LMYQRKDWINSDGKTVKPHDHEEDPKYGKKAKEWKRSRREKKDVRTNEGPVGEKERRDGWVDTWG
jgi:hypothetical protein